MSGLFESGAQARPLIKELNNVYFLFEISEFQET